MNDASKTIEHYLQQCVSLPLEKKPNGLFIPTDVAAHSTATVDEKYLAGAREWFERHQAFGYYLGVLEGRFAAHGITPSGSAVDIGSGFGNTVIPLLEKYDDLRIVASDLSPDLLEILMEQAEKRDLTDRVAAVVLDVEKPCFQAEVADYVFGGAILHHLVDPFAALENITRLLKPGGYAFFLEPFENGHAILGIAFDFIYTQAAHYKALTKPIKFLKEIQIDICARSLRRLHPDSGANWEKLDDKWMFTRSFFERLQTRLPDIDISIDQLSQRPDIYRGYTETILTSYGGFECPAALPGWAWDVIATFDEHYVSSELKRELIIEGAITLHRRAD